MKQALIIVFAAIAVIGGFAWMFSGDVKKPEAHETGLYIGVYKYKGNVEISDVSIINVDTIRKGTKIVDSYTVYAVKDSVTVRTKAGRDSTMLGRIIIKKDSVKILYPITIDSLLKSFK